MKKLSDYPKEPVRMHLGSKPSVEYEIRIPAPVAAQHDRESAAKDAVVEGIEELRNDCQRWREDDGGDMRSVISELDKILDALKKTRCG